ncbi:MAG: hypothetical protein R3E89_08880 [Thiolinea sp.]
MMWLLQVETGRYGNVRIEETRGMLASARFPELRVDWDILFPQREPPEHVGAATGCLCG